MSGTQKIKAFSHMTAKTSHPQESSQQSDWDADDQNLLSATLLATPVQRLAWLEEALHLAYASGALKPRVPQQDG